MYKGKERERAVPTNLAKWQSLFIVRERFARGKMVTSAIEKVPAIAKTLGSIPLAFLIGSSLIMNKIDGRPKNRMVEDRTRPQQKTSDASTSPNAGPPTVNA